MKIIDNALRGIEFKDLGVGATFQYDNNYYLRTEDIVIGAGIVYNATNLESGEMCNFVLITKVIPFNCELIVL